MPTAKSLRWDSIGKSILLFIAVSIGATQSALATFPPRIAVNLGSGICFPVIENDGQYSPAVELLSALPTGNSIYFNTDGTIGFTLKAVDGGIQSNALISYVNANPYLFFGVTPQASTSTYFATDTEPAYFNVANYKSAGFTDLYPGVSGTHTPTGRQLKTSYDVAGSSQVTHIRFQFVNALSMTQDPISDDILVRLSSAGVNRDIILRPARIEETGGTPFVREFVIEPNNTVSLQIDADQTANPIVVEQEILFAPYFHAYTAVEDANNNNNVVVVSAGVNTRTNNGNDSGDDIVVTVLNSAMDEVLATGILAAAGDDIPYSLAIYDPLSQDAGDILVAGSTNSGDFPVEGEVNNTDGFVIQIEAGLTGVLGGVFLGDSDNEAAHDVAFSNSGSILVGGITDGSFPITAPVGFTFKTQLPTGPCEPHEYFCAELNGNLGIDHALPFDGCLIDEPIRVADCDGVYTVGIRFSNKRGSTDTYEMSKFGSNYADGYADFYSDYWGYYALRWKAYNNTSITYSPPSINGVPNGEVRGDHAGDLDDLEGNSSVFSSDPPGGWGHQDAVTAGELAVGVSAAMDRWSTPAFVSMEDDGWNTPIAIKRITWDVDGGWTVADICGPSFSDPSVSIDDFDQSCASLSYDREFRLENVVIATWKQGNFSDNRTWSGTTFEDNYFGHKDYVTDPPDGEEHVLGYIDELSTRTRKSIWTNREIKCETYVDGLPTATINAIKQIRLVDFPVKPLPGPIRTQVDEESSTPELPFVLRQPRPNPASATFSLSYQLDEAMEVKLELLNPMGRTLAVLAEGFHKAARYQLSHNVADLPAGAYFLRLTAQGKTHVQPMNIVR